METWTVLTTAGPVEVAGALKVGPVGELVLIVDRQVEVLWSAGVWISAHRHGGGPVAGPGRSVDGG